MHNHYHDLYCSLLSGNFSPGASAPPSYPQASSSFDSSKVRETANFKTQLASTQRILGLLHEKNAALKQQCDYLNKKALRLQKVSSAVK